MGCGLAVCRLIIRVSSLHTGLQTCTWGLSRKGSQQGSCSH
jgi:hypothetical protein